MAFRHENGALSAARLEAHFLIENVMHFKHAYDEGAKLLVMRFEREEGNLYLLYAAP